MKICKHRLMVCCLQALTAAMSIDRLRRGVPLADRMTDEGRYKLHYASEGDWVVSMTSKQMRDAVQTWATMLPPSASSPMYQKQFATKCSNMLLVTFAGRVRQVSYIVGLRLIPGCLAPLHSLLLTHPVYPAFSSQTNLANQLALRMLLMPMTFAVVVLRLAMLSS